MPRSRKTWVYSPPKPAKPKVPESVKAMVSVRANELIETVLKPKFITPCAEDEQFNHIVDLFTKWHGSYVYFCATWHSPGPYAISPTFESRFARLEYAGDDHFNLAYMRHNRAMVGAVPRPDPGRVPDRYPRRTALPAVNGDRRRERGFTTEDTERTERDRAGPSGCEQRRALCPLCPLW